MKTTQMDIVLRIVRDLRPVRTEEVKIEAMKQGVSCADRFLRWLAKGGYVYSYKLKENKTKTWMITGAGIKRVEGK